MYIDENRLEWVRIEFRFDSLNRLKISQRVASLTQQKGSEIPLCSDMEERITCLRVSFLGKGPARNQTKKYSPWGESRESVFNS
jgi:hypothetical protein